MTTPANSVADRLLQACAAAGVDTVFGLPGVHNLAFWTVEGPDRPRIVGVRHEQTTVYAADGMARLNGGLGVALTTTGPGAANAAGAFGEAAAAKSPVVLIASEVAAKDAIRGQVRGLLHESRDQAAIFEPLAKAVYRPRTAEEACAAMGEAIATALAWPRGPVYIDVPTDVLSQPGPEVQLTAGSIEPVDAASVAAAIAEIERADRIVLWVGGGAVQSGADEAVAALATHLDAAVITTYAARGIVGTEHPCAVGLPPHEPLVASFIAEADLLIAIGTDFDGMMTRNWRMPRPPALVSINVSVEDLAKNFEPTVGVVGDARTVVEALLVGVPARSPRVAAEIARIRAKVWEHLAAEPGAAFVKIVETLTSDVPVVADMAIPGYWLGGYVPVTRSRRLQYPVGWGTLGYALPASVGTAVAAAGGPVLAVCGDGGVMFGLGELATIVQERLPVTLLIVDDGGYGMLRYDQDHAGDQRRGVALTRPDFVALAVSFGIGAVKVDTVDSALGDALDEALKSGEPRVVVLETSMKPPRTTSPRWFE